MTEQTIELQAVRPALLQRILPSRTTLPRSVTVAELQDIRQELTAQQQELLERQRRADRERPDADGVGRQLEATSHQIETWAEQLRFYGDQHEKNRAVLRDVQALAHELSQQQDRLRQLQRVSENSCGRNCASTVSRTISGGPGCRAPNICGLRGRSVMMRSKPVLWM